MADALLKATRACVFDAYGTLFDVHSAVARNAAALGDAATAVSAHWRQKQLEYTWLRALMGAYVDFRQVTADALDAALERHGVVDAALRDRLLDAYLTLDTYPEVPQVLGRLEAKGVPCAILSNGSEAMLEAAVGNAGLRRRFAALLSVHTLRTYKPNPSVYALATERLGVAPEEICFLSSNGWDVHGAAAFGFRCVWINRFGQPRERLPAGPVATIERLDGLLPLLGLD